MKNAHLSGIREKKKEKDNERERERENGPKGLSLRPCQEGDALRGVQAEDRRVARGHVKIGH